MARMKE
jgi:hypothetical protein